MHKADIAVLAGPKMFPDPAIVSKSDAINIVNASGQDVKFTVLVGPATLKKGKRGTYTVPGDPATGTILDYDVLVAKKQNKSKKQILTAPSLIIDD